MWALVGQEAEARITARLAADLTSHAWDTHHGSLREQAEYDESLRLVVSEPS